MRQKLEEVLAELHEQLGSIDDMDEAQLEMLRTATAELQSTLDQAEVNSASLAKRLNDASQQFSQSHPLLTNTVGRIADLLSQMGI